MGRYKTKGGRNKGMRAKESKIELKEKDWRGVLAVIVVLSFVAVFTATLLITRDKELVGLVAATFGGLVSAVVTFYFTTKVKK